ncbi:MAG TPA: serine hydrolase domain-containing protein [Rhizomicrobium sp.]|jgi:CubicO group peptidase (beta-lactamase class C family)|nr:serine hydrolase domain-containing protein [Rhizomicrobium sp.]
MALNLNRRQSVLAGMAALGFSKATASLAESNSLPSAQFALMTEIARSAIAAKLFPGITIAAYRNGEPVFTYAAGVGSIEMNAPMAVNSILRVGSVTKQFTAAAILLLAEDRKLSLDDPLSRTIPEFPNGNTITLRRMLNHTAGLSDYLVTDPIHMYENLVRKGREEEALLKTLQADKPLFDFPPGQNWAYSNAGYALLSIVISRVSGQAYSDFMHNRIFAPLGLVDTGVDDDRAVTPRRVMGYTPAANAPSGFERIFPIPVSLIRGCGDMYSTAGDLCRWQAALLSGKLLKPESLKEMLTPTRLANGSLPNGLPKENGETDEYGFGLYLAKIEGHRRVGHGGGGFGFGSMVFTFPEKGFTAAYLVNCDDGGLDPAPSDKPRDAINDALTKVALG